MEILRTISLYTEEKQLPFVVIGGHAINSYGISRHTGVPLKDRDVWGTLMEKLNYKHGQNDSRFSRYQPQNMANWPIDIMYVNDDTFSEIYKSSREDNFGEASVRVVSPRHLIFLKLHALKHYQEHRFSKDFSDLMSLLKMKDRDLSDEELKEKTLKYASEELYARIQSELKRLV